MTKEAHEPDEVIAIVDNSDKIMGKSTRSEAHKKGLLHREAYVYLINSKKQVLLQKRADNSLWDHSCAGHFSIDENYIEGAIREFEEELGVKVNKSELSEIAYEKLFMSTHPGKNIRFIRLFLIKKDIGLNEFKIDKAEIKTIKYFNQNELNNLLKTPKKMSRSAKYLIEKYILKEIK